MALSRLITPRRTRRKRTMKYAMAMTIAMIGAAYSTPIRTAIHMPRRGSGLRQQHGRAGGAARLERAMRRRGILQRKCLARFRLDLSRKHQPEELVGHR